MVPCRILLIDDSPDLLSACKQVLNGQSRPTTICDSHAAFRLLESHEIGIAILSSRGTNRKTLETLSQLKKRFPSTSFVLATDLQSQDSVLNAFRAGASDIVQSPIQPSGLMASLCRLSDLPKANRRISFNILHLRGGAKGLADELVCPECHFKPANGISLYARSLKYIQKSAHKLVELAHQRPKNGNGLHSNPPIEVSESQRLLTNRSHQSSETQGITHAPALRINFFGSFRINMNDREIAKWSSHKSKMLFAYMLMNHKRRICREVLMDKFWPNTLAGSARNSLNVALHTIRQTLHELDPKIELILYSDDCYCVNPEIPLWVDVEEFVLHWQRSHNGQARLHLPDSIQQLKMAQKLYEGDFIQDELYDDWASMERENLREMYLAVLDRLSDCYLLTNELLASAQLCESILERDNCREDIHRRLMICYYKLGARAKALRQFKKCSEILKSELDVEPTKLTNQLYQEIRHDRLSPAFSNS